MNAVDRLLIYSTARLGNNIRWTDKTTDLPIAAVRLPADDPQYKGLPENGELWRLQLSQPTTGAIEVAGSTTTAWPKRGSVPLLALPDAVEQHGRALVRSSINVTPAIESDGLTPASLPLVEPSIARTDDASPIRVAYRYNPTDCLQPSHAPRLWIGPGADGGASTLVIRYLDLESFYWPDGRGAHRATYQLENYGADKFKPSLPPEAKLASISLNGQTLGPSIAESGTVTGSIRLSPQSRSATVSIYFETQGTSLSAGSSIRPPIIESGVPLLAGEWKIWLPEGFTAETDTRRDNGSFGWRQRLFGPLARAKDAPPFHPLRPADSAHLINGLVDWETPTPPPAAPKDAAPRVSFDSESLTTPSAAGSSTTSVSTSKSNLLSGLSLPGWQSFRETFVANGAPEPVVVLHPPATAAWSVAILLATFLLGRWLCRERGMVLIGLTAFAAIMALLLPAAFAPLATGAMWGFVCSQLAEWPRRLLTPELASNGFRNRIGTAGILVIAAIVGLARATFAQPVLSQPPTRTVLSTAQIERVLIPIDSTHHPTGTKYYLSERFLRELLGSATDRAQTDGQWLLLGASYSGELVESRDRAEVNAGTWALTFSIETLSRDTAILLPLVRDDANWQPTAMLDGVPVPLTWRESARVCAVEIDQPGRYSLTIYCVPKTMNVNYRNRFELAIPPLLSAAVRLHAPAQLSGITIDGVKLPTALGDTPGVLSGEVGQVDHLVVEWPRQEQNSGTSPGLTVSAMNWLHVGSGGTELEAKYIVESGSRRPETLSISYDDHWVLDSGTNSTTEDHPTDASAGRRSIRIPLPVAGAERQEISLRWKLPSAPAAGNFRLPPIELTSISPTQHWFALSTDPALDCTVTDSAATGATSATAKEFLAKWGGTATTATPQIVLANFDPRRVWTLAVRPREAETEVHEVLHVAIGSEALRVVYQANVTPGPQNKYQFHLTVPTDLRVDEVALNEADRRIPTRWTRDAENHINIFFGECATSDYRLSLSGTVPLAPNEPSPLPRITSASPASAVQQVQLYRDDDLHVELQGLQPTEESNAGPAELPPLPWLVRPLGVYHLDEAAANIARIAVSHSQPKLMGDTLTSLARESGAWSATFRCRLTAESGEIDVLRLRVPTTWSGPFDIESSIPVTTETTPLDEHHQIVAIRFATTIAQDGHVDLRIRSPLVVPAGSAASVPEIALEPPAGVHSYVSVPTSLDSQNIAWIDSGVQEATIPKNLLAASFGVAGQRQLEIMGEPFRVSINAQAARQPAPRIRLADIAVSNGRRGSRLIVTRLIVASDSVPECTLQLPADQKLVSVTLDGRPALKSALNDSQWHVALGAAQLPQSLGIVSRSVDGELRDPCRPTLLVGDKPIPVEISLWTVGDSGQSASGQIEGAAVVSAMDQAALRIDRMVSVAESAIATAAEAPSPDGISWLRPWVVLLQGVRDQTHQIMAQPTGPATAQVARSSEEQIDRALKRLDAWLEQARNFLTDPDAPQTKMTALAADSMIFSTQFSTAPEAMCYVAEGGADRLPIQVAPVSPSLGQNQLLALLAVVALAAGCFWLIRSPAAADFLFRWPHIFGVLAGIAWWAWLWPSWFGLLIVAASTWLALRFDWPGRSTRAEASTVLRSTRSH